MNEALHQSLFFQMLDQSFYVRTTNYQQIAKIMELYTLQMDRDRRAQQGGKRRGQSCHTFGPHLTAMFGRRIPAALQAQTLDSAEIVKFRIIWLKKRLTTRLKKTRTPHLSEFRSVLEGKHLCVE
jgi:hypothetical protein